MDILKNELIDEANEQVTEKLLQKFSEDEQQGRLIEIQLPECDVDISVLMGYVNGVETDLSDVYNETLKLYDILVEEEFEDLERIKLLDRDEINRSYVFSLLCSLYSVIEDEDDMILPMFSNPSIIKEKTAFDPTLLLFYLMSPHDDATDDITNNFHESRKMLGLEEKEFTIDNLFDFITKDLGLIFVFLPESAVNGDREREAMVADLVYEAVSKVNYYKAVVDGDKRYNFVKPKEILKEFPELEDEKLDKSFCAFWRGVRNTLFYMSTLRDGEFPEDDFITNDDVFKIGEE